jgi:hypothetical protein
MSKVLDLKQLSSVENKIISKIGATDYICNIIFTDGSWLTIHTGLGGGKSE